jgi:2'-5' RNA ligase
MSTAFKSCNIVLFPSAVVEQQAIEWSRSVCRRFKTRYVLDAQTWHPHITLYQAHYPTNSIEKVQAGLAEITKKVPQFEITMHNFSVLNGFIFYDAIKSPEIAALHLTLLETLNPLREGILTDADRRILADPRIPEKIKQNIQQYAYAFAKDSYIPHMSITRLEEYQEADEAKKLLQTKTMKFTVQELLLTNVGDDGTCNEIYARFQLQD